MNFCKMAVITGSIGCGKSSVCKILLGKGYEIIDADAIAKTLLKELFLEIIETFGAEFDAGGEIDVKKLGKLVFSDALAKSKLEAIMHPKIRERIYGEISRLCAKGKLFFVDIPLFFESKNYSELSPVAVVYAPREIQLTRVVARDKQGEADALSRINSQIDIEKKRAKADFVIDNSGEEAALEKAVEKFLEEVEKWFCKNTAQAETIF